MFEEIIKIILILFSAVVLHECAHGWMAFRLGDPTAQLAGRLTLNPLKHIDPLGTIFLPGVLIILRLMGIDTFVIGWAKPVPVNFLRLNHPKRDMIWVALAGPAVNIALACLFSLVLRVNSSEANTQWLELAVFINLLLAVFNMVPVPPLDGSRLVMGLLPNRFAIFYARLEPYGLLIVMVLLYLGLFDMMVLPVVDFLGSKLGVGSS